MALSLLSWILLVRSILFCFISSSVCGSIFRWVSIDFFSRSLDDVLFMSKILVRVPADENEDEDVAEASPAADAPHLTCSIRKITTSTIGTREEIFILDFEELMMRRPQVRSKLRGTKSHRSGCTLEMWVYFCVSLTVRALILTNVFVN